MGSSAKPRRMVTTLSAVVLCAGKGTRMKTEQAKVLAPLLGRPMAYYPLSRAFDAGAQTVVAVVGHQAEVVKKEVSALFTDRPVSFALQEQQRGTADAVRAAKSALGHEKGAVLVLYGDVPLITTETLQRLINAFRETRGPLAMVSCRPPSAAGYGRVVRENGKAVAVVEDKDANAEQKKIGEINAGIYVADAAFLWASLDKLTPKNAQGELYLTDIVALAAQQGEVAVIEADAGEVEGVNDRAELAVRGNALRTRINLKHMKAGVTLVSPETTFIDEGVEIGPDTIIHPMVQLSGECEIGAKVVIGQGSVVTHSTIGDGTEVKPYSVFEEAVVGPKCVIGPFARLRPGTVLDEGVHVGNFVETKKARLRKGAKANHLTYLGDADVGEKTNIGAGTITCNYDGVNKSMTTIGSGVFIGSDTQLVAPVTVGDGAFVAAGSTVTQDVPANALALSRTKQVNKEGWAEQRRKMLEQQKK